MPIYILEVKDGCTRDVYAKESGLAKYRFTRETIDVYSSGVYNGMLDLDPFAPLDEVTQGLSKLLYKAATNVFPHTPIASHKKGTCEHKHKSPKALRRGALARLLLPRLKLRERTTRRGCVNTNTKVRTP